MSLALALCVAVLLVMADLHTEGTALRIGLFAGACVLATLITFVLPTGWRKRLAPPVAVFVAVAGTLSVFLVGPGGVPPVVDAQKMVQGLVAGPIDQNLPDGIQAGHPEPTYIGDSSSDGKVAAVEVPMSFLPSDSGTIYAEIEVYPTNAAADDRAATEMATLGKIYELPPGSHSGGFCVWRAPGSPGQGDSGASWTCGGVSGLAYAEVTLTPAANVNHGTTQALVSALLRYADDEAKMATG